MSTTTGLYGPWLLSAVSDELGHAFDEVVQTATELGILGIALNKIWGKEASDLTAQEIREVKTRLDDSGLQPVAFGTLCFKGIPVDSPDYDEGVSQDMDRLRRACELGREVGAPVVRIFSIKRSVGGGNPSPILPDGGGIAEPVLERVASTLSAAVQLAQRADIDLAVENVRSCYGNTGENTARIVAAVGSPRLKVVWDPANHFVSCGRTTLDGYHAVSPFLYSVDMKNAVIVDDESGATDWRPIGDGAIDYRDQLRDLAERRFRGPLTIETHWRGPTRALPPATATAVNVGELRMIVRNLDMP